jgi:hypothetical protein
MQFAAFAQRGWSLLPPRHQPKAATAPENPDQPEGLSIASLETPEEPSIEKRSDSFVRRRCIDRNETPVFSVPI